MALTESQKLKIAKILSVTYIEVQEQVTYLGTTHLTSEAEAQIGEAIDLWDSNNLDTDFVTIEGNLKNFGANVDPNKLRNSIRQTLATFLYFTELMKGGGSARLERA